jgi:hypothetical protein
MRHQKLHLIGKNTPIAQYEVFPQTGHVRRIQQGHMRLLGRTAAFAMVAGTACGNHVHPVIDTVLRERNNVFARQAFFMKVFAAISTNITIAGKQLAIGQAGLQVEWIDIRDTLGADDAVDRNNGLLAGYGIVPAMEHRDFATRFPSHLAGSVMNYGLLD